MSYAATERAWVRRILVRLTPEQRKVYEERCKTWPRHRNGKLYDGAKARIAEQILLESAQERRDNA